MADPHAPDRRRTICLVATRVAIVLAPAAATLLVGWLDYGTGTEIRVLALYFLPLLLAGWHLGTGGAALQALFTTLVWLAAAYASGTRFSSSGIWVVNGLTEGLGFVFVAVLVARLRRALASERSLSRQDALTGLLNRRAFVEHVELGLALSRRSGRPVALAFLDLDNFKQVNDNLGHAHGDHLLGLTAALILRCARASDTVARLGGDEFALFLPDTDGASAEALADRIRAAVAADVAFSALHVSASVGIVCDVGGTLSADTLLRQADAAMYHDKRVAKGAATHSAAARNAAVSGP